MITPEDEQALEIARGLARAGIPVFAAPPDDSPIGFRLPYQWQQTSADPSRVDAWRPGWALCAVMGYGLDLVDVDLYAGADARNIDPLMPHHYAMAGTASGGIHYFVASLGVRSKDKLFPGIDIKAGAPDGKGHGFAFIAPTVKASKVTGKPSPYFWQAPPDLAALSGIAGDHSGQALADLLLARKQNGQAGNGNGQHAPGADPLDEFFSEAAARGPSPWQNVAATLAAEGRNNGVMRLASSLRETSSLSVEEALSEMYGKVWPLIDQALGGHEFPAEEFESVVRAIWRQYPAGPVRQIEQAEQAMNGDQPAGGWTPPTLLDLTDAHITRQVARVLSEKGENGHSRYCWAPGLNWMMWNKYRWVPVDVSEVWNEVRKYFIFLHSATARRPEGADQALLVKLTALLAAARIKAVTDLARGHELIARKAEDFDAHPDVINTPEGIVSLRTGEVSAHDPAMMLTKLTAGNYRPGYKHDDWEQALTALDAPERTWYQGRIGQAITGYPPSDGIMPVLQGSGANSKTCCTTDGPVRALGDYADMASHKLITSQKAGSSEHSTEMADLRGQRLLVGEELAEGRSIDVTALKRIQDVGKIKARYVHKDNISFGTSHSLMCTTNYVPVISETDHGTWRRLALLRFRYTFRGPGEPLVTPLDRRGDPELKYRIRYNYSGQHDAIVTWAVDGAIRWYAGGMADAPVTDRIKADTLDWRASSDHILGFWTEHLTRDQGVTGDHTPCISASHLMEVFNAWLTQNGHNPWSKERFATHFGGHEMTTRSGVEYRVTKALDNLSWCTDSSLCVGGKTLSKQMRVWVGVRWQNPDDQQKPGQGDEGGDPPGNSPSDPSRESYTKGSSPSSPCQPGAPSSSGNDLPETNGDLPTDVAGSNQSGPSPTSSPAPGDAPVRPQPPVTQSENGDGPPPAGKTRKARAPKATKPPKPEGPDPELTGPVLSLPAVVNRAGAVSPCTTEQAAQMVRGEVQSAGALTVDVENTGYPIGHPEYKLRTVQLGGEHYAAVFDAADPEQRQVIRELLAEAPVLHAHSAPADLVPLEQAGLCTEEAWFRMDDTVLHAKLADPALSGSDADGLKDLARDVLGDAAVTPAANDARKKIFASGKWLLDTNPLTPVERSGWAQIDPRCEAMIRYAGSDVLDTAPLPRVLPSVDPAILDRERAMQRICARISHRGMRLDPDRVRELRGEHRAAKKELGEQISSTYGIENPDSPLQVAPAFAELGAELPRTDPTDRHPQGQPSTKESALLPIKRAGGEAGELARIILDFRSHATALKLILEPFGVQVEHGDGRVRSVVYTLGADTGRTSMTRANLQQLSREGGIRSCITADEGMMLISADFQAVELRTAAALSGDQALYEMILAGDAARARGDKETANANDLHWKIAKQVWGPDATKSDRYNAKRGVFGRLYGSGIPGIARTLGISLAEAQAVADTLDALAPGVAAWSQAMQRYVRQGGTSFQTYSGRIVWLDKKFAHKSGNFAIQGTAREFLADGLIKWDKTHWGNSVVFPVHDEVVTMVPAHQAEEATETLVEAMSTELNGMKIIAEPSKPSFFWADAS